jgi:hypothetical protein
MKAGNSPAALALDPACLKLQLDAAIASAALTVQPKWRAAIDAHFEAIAKAAALVIEFPLDDDLDPGPVFSA